MGDNFTWPRTTLQKNKLNIVTIMPRHNALGMLWLFYLSYACLSCAIINLNMKLCFIVHLFDACFIYITIVFSWAMIVLVYLRLLWIYFFGDLCSFLHKFWHQLFGYTQVDKIDRHLNIFYFRTLCGIKSWDIAQTFLWWVTNKNGHNWQVI